MSKKSLGAKALIYPLPVLIAATYGEDGTVDAMNIAYGGGVNSNRIQINIGVRHKTSENIRAKKAFTLSIADKKNLIPADYVGFASGNDVSDKFEKTGWTATKSESVDAPVIEELPITLHCKVEEINQYGETLRIVAEVVDTTVDASVLKEDGTIDVEKLSALVYDGSNHNYLTLTNDIAGKAFADGKKIQ